MLPGDVRVAGESPFVVAPLPGFTPQVGRLVAMMRYARRTTLETVDGLTTEQLDYALDPASNTIGALLAHVAAVEVAYQRSTFDGQGLTRADAARWGAALALGDRARRRIRGRPLESYLADLEVVRAATLWELAQRDDAWLEITVPFWDGLPANNYFMWFHVFEDEINHRGQMRIIRKRLPSPEGTLPRA